MVGDHDALVGGLDPVSVRALPDAEDEGGLSSRHLRKKAPLVESAERRGRRLEGLVCCDGVAGSECCRGDADACD